MSYIEINSTKCKSCFLCSDVCPHKLIQKSETLGKSGDFVVEFNDKEKKCIACAQCAIVCPEAAIEKVVKE